MTKKELLKVISEAAKDGWAELTLGNEEIKTLPAEIKKLVNLPSLYLSGNQLTALPVEIKELVNLRQLYLSGNRFTTLPADISELVNLRIFFLDGNQLTALPAEIKGLVNLEYLLLHDNQLTALPLEIEELVNLRSLNLSQNQLTALPAEIKGLVNLQYLYLHENHLVTLPSEIKELVQLHQLFLHENQLSALPGEIHELVKLQVLTLDRNPFTVLPAEIKGLVNLQSLYVDENQLRNSADTIIQIKGITLNIWIGGRYDTIAPEMMATFKNGRDLIDYYFKTQTSESRALNEAKIVIIGQGNVGKTSLRQRLTGEPYENAGRTEGVEIRRWETEVRNRQTRERETVKLNVWDFGGQEIYHTTHQFFFRSRCLYVLVIDARLGVSESRLHYWLRQAQAFGKNAPVIVVLNKAEEKDKELLDRRYERERLAVLSLRKFFPSIFNCVLISCDKQLEIVEVKEEISEAISRKMPEVFSALPAKWFEVKEKLEKLNVNYLTKEKFDEICAEVPKSERKQLIEILDALGIIVSFGEDELSDTKVIKPEWITKGIYKILSSYKLDEKNGKVVPGDIREIFAGDKENYPTAKIDYILRLMEKYDLCFIESSGGGKRNYLFPVAFSIQERPHQPLGKNALHFEYRYKNEYYDSIIVRFLKNAYTIFGPGFVYWRKGVTGRLKRHQIYVRADDVSNRIEIKIDGDSGGRQDLLERIIQIIDEIHNDFGKLEVYKVLIHPKKADIAFPYDTVIRRFESGKDSIRYTDPAGEGIDVSIRYLLEGVEVPEVHENEGEIKMIEPPEQIDLEGINAALIEKDALLRKKSILDTISWILWIVIVLGLLALAIWRISQIGDYTKPDFLVVVGIILAFFQVLPFIVSSVLSFIFGGNEETKRKFISAFYRFPVGLLQGASYFIAGFDKETFEKTTKTLQDLIDRKEIAQQT